MGTEGDDAMAKALRLTLMLMLVGCVLLVAGCSKNATPAREAVADGSADDDLPEQPRPARVLPLPTGAAPSQEGPAGPLAWDAPEGWVPVPPASSLRFAQYRVPGPGGDGECAVFYFGPGQGGDPSSNAARWANQFRQPDGSPSVEAMRLTRLEGTRVGVQLVEVTGTYDGGMTMTDAPAEEMENYMLLGAIAEGTDAPWFFKFTGPEATVRAQREPFLRMMESLRVGS